MRSITPDIAYLQTVISNVFFVGAPGSGDREWTLIDAGMPLTGSMIRAAARKRYGDARPNAIVLTHGHFDHIGAVRELAELWVVPVFAHRLETPYLTGRADYPPPDPTVGGGLMARMSPLFPRRGIDITPVVRELPPDGAMPDGVLPGWRWIHAPGHAPGQVALWREEDRTLIAGDAFTTTKQESLFSVATQTQAVYGPPAYFTIDWDQALRTVEHLASLRPMVGATGHGIPMEGEALRRGLHDLVMRWDEVAKPTDGRYVRRPAVADERGMVSVPPPVPDPLPKMAAAVAVATVAGFALAHLAKRRPSASQNRATQREPDLHERRAMAANRRRAV